MRWIGILLLALIVAGAVSLWSNDYSWRQKLTVEVQTPDGIKTGSSTIKVAWHDGIGLLPDPPSFTNRMRGEATVVDLGDGRFLFALLSGSERLAMRVFSDERLPQSTDALVPYAKNVLTQRGNTREVERDDYPLLVTFTDINDPATVKQVDPNDLAASFCSSASTSADATVHGRKRPATEGGDQPDAALKEEPCVELKRITLTITDEPVTDGKVEEVLGWLDWPRDKLLAAGNGRNPVQLQLGAGLLALAKTHFRRN